MIKAIKKSIFSLLFIGLLSYIPLKAQAWGMIGHRVVGEIAEGYLNTKTKKALFKIMGNENLAMAANWGDFIKSDTSFKYLNNWHFVNFPEGLDKQGVFNFLTGQTEPNIYNKIEYLTTVLKNASSSLDEKKLAVRMIIHMVGDLHQPMHTARKEDLGGNRFFVTWFGQKSNLHKVWDESLIDYQQLSYTEYAKAINYPTKDQLNTWKNSTLFDATYESYEICNKIYANLKPESRLGYEYNFIWVSTLNEQLLKGGIRLAKVMNDIFS